MKFKTVIWLTIFSIAMGYMESAIVIYLRKLFYPHGFQFPLAPLDPHTGLVEVLREAATIIMLISAGILSAKPASLRFACFIFCFAVWDLFYYIFLWMFIGWPASLFTWDILFLIPVPWVGPVITPCIISLTMMLFALSIFHFQRMGLNTKIKLKEWLMFIAGSTIVIISFIWDYLKYASKNISPQNHVAVSTKDNMLSDITNYIPDEFNWPLFLTGEFILLLAITIFISRMKRKVRAEIAE